MKIVLFVVKNLLTMKWLVLREYLAILKTPKRGIVASILIVMKSVRILVPLNAKKFVQISVSKKIKNEMF